MDYKASTRHLQLNITYLENDFVYPVYDRRRVKLCGLHKSKLLLLNYIKFEQDFICHSTRSQRSLKVQLRMDKWALHIETGHYLRKPFIKRKCLVCRPNLTEDENHFWISVQCMKMKVNYYTTKSQILNYWNHIYNLFTWMDLQHKFWS